ncbi:MULTISPECIES: phage tail assembly protein [unclassified Streptomyces]|uniref:phage tail assembly protein n=1 Tax=unclassified Streptomyces TaxID=2593676 RepID=UPI0003736BEB|nr:MULTISPECIES: phage tail assembly protein [unclassified Streptomyces]MYT31750.1 hypothetical protein [Streptomyces sp. SID8354]
MASFSLDDIRNAAEAKYGSTDIEIGGDTVRLLNPLRLAKDARTKLSALQDHLGTDGADQEELLSEAIRLVAEHPKAAEKLLDAVNGDLAVLAEIFDRYGKGTQAGEASASAV